MKIWIYYLILVSVIIIGCDSGQDNNKKEEIQGNNEQFQQNSEQDQTPQQKVEIMTEFTPEQSVIKDLVTEVIYKNLEATQAEDFRRVMETIHEESPQRSSTERGMEYVFANYDMVYKLEDLKFISITENDVIVMFRQTTKAVKGTGFANTRRVGFHSLKKSKDGNWKIFKTADISSEILR